MNIIELKDVRKDTMIGMSWVRLTHEPTGISVECRETQSQHKNYEIALQQLELACVQEVCENMDAKARKEAFDRGHPICYLKDGTPVHEYPDGRIIPVKR